jgi:hypothetical protein
MVTTDYRITKQRTANIGLVKVCRLRIFAKPETVCDLNQLLIKQVIECYFAGGRN